MLITGCGKAGTHPAKRISEARAGAFTVKGEVLWRGPTPIVYPIPTNAYHGACGKRRVHELLELQKARLWHKRIKDVAVWLEPVWEEMTPEEIANLKMNQSARVREPVEIIEKGCLFQPGTVVVPVGTLIDVVNEDRMDHWFAIEGKCKEKAQYVQHYGEAPPVFTFETPGIYHLPQGAPAQFVADKVDKWHLVSALHRWMDAWIVVTDKIWFDKMVDKRGIFEITGVPSGVYRVYAWHPLLGESSSVIKVPDDIHRLVGIDFYENPYRFVTIPSTVITTYGEVEEEKNVWQNIENR